MRYLIAVAVLVISVSCCTFATTMKEFQAKSDAEQTAAISGFIDKMTTDMRAQNEPLAVNIRNWFAVVPEGKTYSEGMVSLFAQLTAIERQAAAGKVDPSKIQLESVIVWVVKQKFPPPQAPAKK